MNICEKVRLELEFDFSAAEVEIFYVRSDSSSESKMKLLTLSFAEIDSHPDSKFFQKNVFDSARHFAKLTHEDVPIGHWESFVDRARLNAESGDPEKILELANALAQFALISKNLVFLEEAESQYSKAAEKMHVPAMHFLDGPWNGIKSYYRDRILSNQ